MTHHNDEDVSRNYCYYFGGNSFLIGVVTNGGTRTSRQKEQMQAHPTQKRNLDKIFVISPEGIGDSRWREISKHLASYRPRFTKTATDQR